MMPAPMKALRRSTLSDQVRRMTRAQLVTVLERDAGIQCYDDESVDVLRTALRIAVRCHNVPRRRLDELVGE
jgi:hypothetical protein